VKALILCCLFSLSCAVTFRDIPEIRVVQPIRVDTVFVGETDLVTVLRGLSNEPLAGHRVISRDSIEVYFSGETKLYVYDLLRGEWSLK